MGGGGGSVKSIRVMLRSFTGHGVLNKYSTGNTKEGSITIPLTSCLTGLESAV